MSNRKAHKGDRVAHATIDSKTGLARTGTVEDVIADEEGALVAARWDDEPDTVEAFDEREIVPLAVSLGATSPVVLHPRHLWALLKRPQTAFIILIALFAGAGLNIASGHYNWEIATTLSIGLGLVLVIVLLSGLITKFARK